MAWIALADYSSPWRRVNLEALRVHHPGLAERLPTETHRRDILLEPLTPTLVRCKKITPDGGEECVDLHDGHATAVQRFLQQVSAYRPNQDWVFISRCGAGNILHFFSEWPVTTRPMIVLEEDPGLLLAAFSCFDLRNLASSSLVHWEIGPACEESIIPLLSERFTPFLLTGSSYRLWAGDLVSYESPGGRLSNLGDAIQSWMNTQCEHIQEIKQRFQQAMESLDPSRQRKVHMLVHRIGCWHTLGWGMAEGFQEQGVDVQVTELKNLNDYASILRANYDILCAAPDALFTLDFSPDAFLLDFIRCTRLPRLIWMVDDVVNLPQVKASPYDVAFPSDEALGLDITRRGTICGCEIWLAVSPRLEAQYDPALAADVSFVGSIHDSSPIRAQLSRELVEWLNQVIESRMALLKRSVADILRDHSLPESGGMAVCAVLRKTIAKQNMSDETLLRYFINMECIRVRRTRMIVALKEWGIQVYGSPDWRPILQEHDMESAFRGRYLTMQEGFNLYRSSLISINVHSMDVHSCPNERDLEVPLCGGFLLTDLGIHARERLPEIFETGREVAVYDDPSDLAAKVQYYVDRPDEREAISRAARERIARQHTFAHRAADILQFMRDRGSALFPVIPEAHGG